MPCHDNSMSNSMEIPTCGAKILPQQSHVVGDSQGSNYSGGANSSSYLAQGLTLYSGQYQLVNNSNNQPYSNVKYIVTYADGRTVEESLIIMG